MTKTNPQPQGTPQAGNLVPFHDWVAELGKTRATGHRWRQDYKFINAGVVNIFGRLYITRETISEFERRASAGELYREATGTAGEWGKKK